MGAAEARRRSREGALSMEVQGAGAKEVEERRWAVDMALIAARPRDPNRAQFNHTLGL